MGANNEHFPVKSRNREVVTVEGSFAPNGAGVIDATQQQGRGFSVTKTGNTGEYIITLEEQWNRLLFHDFGFAHGTPAKYSACMGAIVLAPAPGVAQTITFVVFDQTGTAINIPAAVANRIYIELRLQRTGMDP